MGLFRAVGSYVRMSKQQKLGCGSTNFITNLPHDIFSDNRKNRVSKNTVFNLFHDFTCTQKMRDYRCFLLIHTFFFITDNCSIHTCN